MKSEKSRGFTLIELLIVVVVITTLLGLMFRLAGVGEDQAKRNRTIARMQKLEFALSGYYAAFGSYPPVPLHGSRDIFCDVNDHGIQKSSGGTSSAKLEWVRVRAACLSQPVACEFPYNGASDEIKESAKLLAQSYADNGGTWASIGNFDVLENNIGRLSRNAKSTSWQDIQVFKFGVMSFLMPRYLFMVAGDKDLYDSDTYNAQWKSQNDLATLFRFDNGKRLYSDQEGWEKLQEDTNQHKNNTNTSDYDREQYRRILMQPSQAVCARWMQALDGIVSGGRTFYGVNTALDHGSGGYHNHGDCSQPALWMLSAVYAPGDSRDNSYNNQYVLDGMTVRDGWGMDLFYYSPPPYQGYRLWSAGPDGKTIPPWVDPADLTTDNRKTAAEWIADDIVGLSTPSS